MVNYENKQTQAYDFEIKMLAADGSFSGYASVYGNTDSYNDVIVNGAFDDFLAANDAGVVKLLWQHDPSQPIGTYKVIKSDEKGLYVEGQLLVNDVAKAKEAYALLKAGAINGLSIGFTINQDGAVWGNDGKRYINSVALWEVSVVTFPANKLATVQGVKNVDLKNVDNIRDFEAFLRDVGKLPSAKAKSIASHGFKEGTQRDVESEEKAQTEASIREILQTLKDGVNQL